MTLVSTRCATTSCAMSPTAPMATSHTRASSSATTAIWPTTSATCSHASRPWSAASAGALGLHRAPTVRSPAWRPTSSPPPRRRGIASRLVTLLRPRGGSFARPTHTSKPTSRGKQRRDRPTSLRYWGMRWRRCGSSRSSPRSPSRPPRSRSGGGWACPVAPEDQRVPDAAQWGGYPGGLPVEKGAPLFPRRTG